MYILVGILGLKWFLVGIDEWRWSIFRLRRVATRLLGRSAGSGGGCAEDRFYKIHSARQDVLEGLAEELKSFDFMGWNL
jgi:hypothetical protein